MPQPSIPQGEEKPMKAVRMLFSAGGEHLHLVSQQSGEMVRPPSDPVQGNQGPKGFWYEPRDVQDRPLYRRVMHNPMREDVEVFADDPKQSVARHTAPNRKGVFTVVVPDTEDGHNVTLASRPSRRKRSTASSDASAYSARITLSATRRPVANSWAS
jgi:hypothetical protein